METVSLDSERLLESLLAAAPDDLATFEQLCRKVEDWDSLINCALVHSVESLLYYYVSAVEWKLPPEIKERLERWRLVKQVWQVHSKTALDEILATFDSAAVPSVVLKGPMLGERLYPDPSIRLSADLDVLVAPRDLHRATAALAEIGYQPVSESKARFLRKYHYHTVLSRSCPPVLELHFNLSNGFGTVIPAEGFLARADIYRTGYGAAARILSPEDEMLYLSVHAAGHRFLRLSWLCDIKLLLRRHPDLDWDAVISRARSLKLHSALLFTCDILLQRLRVQPSGFDQLAFQRVRSRVAGFLLSLTRRQPDCSRRSLLGGIAFSAMLCDDPVSAAQFLQRQFLLIVRRRAHRHFPSITPEDWAY
jgi:hypothetical protein